MASNVTNVTKSIEVMTISDPDGTPFEELVAKAFKPGTTSEEEKRRLRHEFAECARENEEMQQNFNKLEAEYKRLAEKVEASVRAQEASTSSGPSTSQNIDHNYHRPSTEQNMEPSTSTSSTSSSHDDETPSSSSSSPQSEMETQSQVESELLAELRTQSQVLSELQTQSQVQPELQAQNQVQPELQTQSQMLYELQLLRGVPIEIQSRIQLMLQIQGQIRPDIRARLEEMTREDDDEMIPIGINGTKIRRGDYKKVRWTSHSQATRDLMMLLFPRTTLAKSTLTGKPSPAFRNVYKARKEPLDHLIVQDIIECVSRKCNVLQSAVRLAITIKCADEAKLYNRRVRNNLRNEV